MLSLRILEKFGVDSTVDVDVTTETVLENRTGVGTHEESVAEKPKEEDEEDIGKISSRRCNTRSLSGVNSTFPITVLT
jgi:hypothetical protein